MTENEQIEELAGDAQIGALAKELHGYCQAPCPNGGCHTCAEYRIARNIYSKDYRKVERGEWIAHPRTNRSPTRGRVTSYNVYYCSICERSNGKRKSPFCPRCGADMRGE